MTAVAWRDLALSLHQGGQLSKAEPIYLELMRSCPLDAEIPLLLAMLNAQLERIDQSFMLFRRAMVIDPANADIQFNLGLLFEQQKQLNPALDAFDRALLINDKVVLYWFNAALTHHQLGQLEEALSSMKHALRNDTSFHRAWSQRAILLMALDRFEESKRCLDSALALDPSSASTLLDLAQLFQKMGDVQSAFRVNGLALIASPLNARAHFNFSLLNAQTGSQNDVMLALERALVCDPAFASAWFNLGFVAKAQRRPLDAQIYIERSLLVRPLHANGHNNLGVVFKDQGLLDLAIRCYDRSIAIDPSDVQGLLNKANALQDLKQIERSLLHYEWVLMLKDDHVDAHLSRSFAFLQNGRFQEGWDSYEWRWFDPKLSSPILETSNPQLKMGERSERLLIWPEQGVGTEVMFAKFLNHVASLACSVTVKLDPRLTALMARTHPNLTFISSEMDINDQDFEHHLPIGSLGRWFGKDLESISSTAGKHLKVDEQRKLDIVRRHKASGDVWIGVNWKSRSSSTGKDRSLDLTALIHALDLPHVRYVDLQYGDTSHDVESLRSNLGIELLRISGLDTFNDLDGLAALISCCDWVVSVDNSTAHLSGATGTPTLILLPFNSDWRWLKAGIKTPWYENAHLFWQKQIGDWSGALRDTSKFLQQALQK